MNGPAKNKQIINDLLLIQYDRIAAYENAAKWFIDDESACKFFGKIADQSRNFILELRKHIDPGTGDPADRPEQKGELYRNWTGIRQFSPGTNLREFILSCEQNERATERLYQEVLTQGETLFANLQDLISDQLKMIHEFFAYINSYKEGPVSPEITDEKGRPSVSFRN